MSEAKAKLFAAMAKAFGAIEGAKKDADNPAFKRDGKVLKYADLESVVDAIKPALVANELFFAQINHEQQGGVCIETIVCHSSGEQMSFGRLFVPAAKQDAQGYGSALTYARRYSLMSAFGVCPEDDDGNAASQPRPQQDQRQRQPEKQAQEPEQDKAAIWANGFIERVGKTASVDELVALEGKDGDLLTKLSKERGPLHMDCLNAIMAQRDKLQIAAANGAPDY